MGNKPSADTRTAIEVSRVFNQSNPRFVLTVGAIQEQFPDVPETVALGIYDRQKKAMVVTINNHYGNLICLETTDHGQPFTTLENWLNQLSNADLASEDLPITR